MATVSVPIAALPDAGIVNGRLLDVNEVADFLHLRPVTVLLWHRKGKLPRGLLVGRKLMWPTWEISDWVNEQITRRDHGHEGHDGKTPA
jgi:predicted DNA-binding transcriptional regulator AlpA